MSGVTKKHTWGRPGKELVGSSGTLVRVAETTKNAEVVKGWRSVKENSYGRLVVDGFGWEKVKEMDSCLKRVRPKGERHRTMIEKSPHGVAKSSNDPFRFTILRGSIGT